MKTETEIVAAVICNYCAAVVDESEATIEFTNTHEHKYICETCWLEN